MKEELISNTDFQALNENDVNDNENRINVGASLNKKPTTCLDVETESDSSDRDEESPLSPSAIKATKDDGNKGDNLQHVSMSIWEMLAFVIPCLGIYMAAPMLSTIDNIFVGRFVGTEGLAALSPATLCIDQVVYLFSFLGKATTGLVARAYAFDEQSNKGDLTAARNAGSPPTTVALVIGIVVTIYYEIGTDHLLALLNVPQEIQADATAYIRWRGSTIWIVLVQTVALNVLLAVRDAKTPSLIVLGAVGINVVLDAGLVVWPWQLGLMGAAIATAIASIVSCSFMMGSLGRQQLLSPLRIPTRSEVLALGQFVGPLMVVTLSRICGWVFLQRAVRELGVPHLAAYQICVSLMILFGYFGDPVSQLGQTFLPPLVESKKLPHKNRVVRDRLYLILKVAVAAAMSSGGAAGLICLAGSSIFTSDEEVQEMVREAAPAVFLAVVFGNLAIALDGALLASRDFGFIIFSALSTLLLQWTLLFTPWCNYVWAIMGTFACRLSLQAFLGYARISLGYGELGKAMAPTSDDPETSQPTSSCSTSWLSSMIDFEPACLCYSLDKI